MQSEQQSRDTNRSLKYHIEKQENKHNVKQN